MNFKTLSCLSGLVAMLGLTSCFDDGYDLSNIDTTSRGKVDNLVIPIQLDAVTLGDIITFDDDSKIKTVNINGQDVYALVENGDFHSDKIHINAVTAAAPRIDPVSKVLTPSSLPLGAKPKGIDIDPSKLAVTYGIENMGQEFSYHLRNIDESVVDITSIEVEALSFELKLSIASELSDYEQISFRNMVIRMPKGLDATTSVGNYDPETGVWKFDEYNPEGGEGLIRIKTNGIDLAANGCKIEDHEMDFTSELFVESGELVITPVLNNGIPSTLPSQLDFTVSFEVGNITATAFSGTINYKLDGSGLNIDPVSLKDIPDFLSKDGTQLGLANPQVYIQVNNPVAGDGLSCRTGIELSAIRPSYVRDFIPDDDKAISIGYDKGTAGPYNFVLAPSDNGLATPADYKEGLDFIKFSGLRQLLLPDPAVNGGSLGLPDKIGIDLIDPQIPSQPVANFRFGRDLPGITGKYELLAPLALTGESCVHYSDKETGWGIESEDGELTVEKLSVKLTLDNATPLGFELKAYPLDKNGNRIANVTIEATKVEANKTQDVEITMTGAIKGLDGIEYVAEAFADDSEKVLAPGQTLKLTNIRVTASGYYDYIDKDYNK